MLAIGCFAIGALLPAFYSSFPPVSMWLGTLGCILILGRRFPLLVKALVFFLVGSALNCWQLYRVIDRQLPVVLDHRVVSAQFELISLVDQTPHSAIFTGRIISALCTSTSCEHLANCKVRLSWYRPKTALEPGQVWRAELKLKRPRGFVNPGGFDYQAWLLGQHLIASGYVKSNAELIETRKNWAVVRESIHHKIMELSRENRFARFWPALILAERSAITQADWTVLQRTGTVHLMAISGLHIGLVALLWHWIGVGIARLICCWHKRKTSGVFASYWLPALLSCSAALLYAALAGFSIATTRALLACLFIQFSRLSGWNLSPIRLFLSVLAAVLIWDPFAGASPGFWLSFWAVFCLLLISGWQVAQPEGSRLLSKWVRLQLMLSMALVVPLLALGQALSLTAPLANLIAIPLMSIAVVPVLIGACLLGYLYEPLAMLAFSCVDWVFSGLWWFLSGLSQWQGSIWTPSVLFSKFLLAVISLALILLFLPSVLRVRVLAGLLLVAALLLPRKHLDAVRLTILDVGQGLAVVLQDASETLVYDTGPSFSDQFDAGARIVLPFLRQQGVNHIHLVVSHADLDHSGGAASIAEAMVLGSLKLGEPLKKTLPTEAEYCDKGQVWRFGRARVDVLWPPAGQGLSSNAASCVVLIQFNVGAQPYKLLFTGDIDAKVEAEILPKLPPQIDVLIAPHHGSGSSSSLAFVRRVAPRYVVYSAGFKNPFGHPHGRVRQRYQRMGSQELNTADSGAIQFIWTPAGETTIETRKYQRRIWFW